MDDAAQGDLAGGPNRIAPEIEELARQLSSAYEWEVMPVADKAASALRRLAGERDMILSAYEELCDALGAKPPYDNEEMVEFALRLQETTP